MTSTMAEPNGTINGAGNQMPLTEYSARPTSKGSTTASTSIPQDFLLPDGHPDVNAPLCVDMPDLT